MSIAQGKIELPVGVESAALTTSEGNRLIPPAGLGNAHAATLKKPLWQQIAQIAATVPNSDVLAAMAAAIGTEFGVEGCVISTVHPIPFQKITTAWMTPTTTLTAAQVLANYPPLAAIVCAQAEVLMTDWPNLPTVTGLAVPLRHQGQVQGVIALLSRPVSPWSASDIEELRAIAGPVGTAIAQVLLHQQVQKQAQYQSLISQLTLAIRNAIELPQILNLALDGIAEVLQVDQGTVLRVKYWDPRQTLRSVDRIPRARVLVECAWQQPDLASVIELHPTASTLSNSFWVADCALCQQLFINAAVPLILTDRPDFPTLSETVQLAPIFHPETLPAVLVVALESKNRILGFLALQQSHPRAWQPEEIELAELVAAQLSSAIMQTETLRQVESLVEERTAQLQQSLELQAKLYEITRKQIEKLRAMNQRMDEFLSTLSHELRTPLTSMMLAIRMLREADLTDDRRQRYLNILEQQCTQETHLVNDLLALQELETKQVAMQVQSVNLTEMLAERAQSFAQQWAAKGLRLEINQPAQIIRLTTDRPSLNRVLLELLTNAGKYSDPTSTVRFTVVEQPNQTLVLTIANQGAVIAAEELPHIFDKFRRCQGMTQNAVPGTGLGLALVKSLVQHLNGTITATSAPIADSSSYETCFTVTLPLTLEVGKQ